MSIIESICKWNTDRENTDYDPALEFNMLQEELMEYVHSYIRTVNDKFGQDIHESTEEWYKENQPDIAWYVESPEFLENWRVNQLDALCDLIFVAVGSMYKLLGDKDKVESALYSVIEANERKGMEKNKDGKIIKPSDFEGPEEELRILIKEAYDNRG